MSENKPPFTCMPELSAFIESNYCSDIASLSIIKNGDEFLRKRGGVSIFLNIFPRILPQPVGNTETDPNN